MKTTLFAVSLFTMISAVAGAAEVQSLKCESDMRPVDGNYASVELAKNDAGKYDLSYHVITAGFGSPVSDTTVLLAKNLDNCVFGNEEARVLRCYKTQRETGEQTNSGFTSNLVSVTQIADTAGRLSTEQSFELSGYSPQLYAGAGKPGFPHMDRPGYFSTSFKAKASQGVIMNRCVIK